MKIVRKIKDFLIRHRIVQVKPMPGTVIIDISNACNALCPFCSRQLSPIERRKDLMSREMFYEIMRQVEEIPTVNKICLSAFGEPMLHPCFDEFVEYVKAKGYAIFFPTNMSVAHKHFEAMLKADNIMFSIEGHDKESYERKRVNLNFERVYSNVVEFDKLVRENKARNLETPMREINFLIDKKSEIDKFIGTWGDYVERIGVRPILYPLVWNKTFFEQKKPEIMSDDLFVLNRKVKNMFCRQPFNTLYIKADGNISLCCSDYDCSLDFGNYKNLLKDFLTNENHNKVRNEFAKNQLEVCKDCFQNNEVDRKILFDSLPELKKYEDDEKIIIYSNR